MHIFLYYIVPFVVVLGILIFFHELGHFLVAKHFGGKVLKFSLGFGPKLIGKKIGETEYLISLFPLGGYVKMLGENGEEGDEPLTPQEEMKVSVTKAALVIGGGVTGIQTALDLADSGHEVYLVEKEATIGGIMAALDKTYPTMDCSI